MFCLYPSTLFKERTSLQCPKASCKQFPMYNSWVKSYVENCRISYNLMPPWNFQKGFFQPLLYKHLRFYICVSCFEFCRAYLYSAYLLGYQARKLRLLHQTKTPWIKICRTKFLAAQNCWHHLENLLLLSNFCLT